MAPQTAVRGEPAPAGGPSEARHHVRLGPGGTVHCLHCGDTSQLPSVGALRVLFEAGSNYFAAHQDCRPPAEAR